jgi:hypothetical protein
MTKEYEEISEREGKPTCRLCRMTQKIGCRESPPIARDKPPKANRIKPIQRLSTKTTCCPFILKFQIILRVKDEGEYGTGISSGGYVTFIK